MKKLITILAVFLISLNSFSIDYVSTFKQGEDIFFNSDNQVNAIPVFESIVQSYELGELPQEAYPYYMKSLEYLCLLYLKKGDQKSSKDMLVKIIKTNPAHKLNSAIFPRKLRTLFANLKKELVGYIDVKCPETDFKCIVDGKEAERDETGKIPVLEGKHTVEITKPNFSTISKEFEIKVGETITVDAPIIRIKASATILTSPPNVKVYLDGVYVGETSGTAPLDYLKEHVETIQELGITPSELSNYFVINNLDKGEHELELKRDCYKTEKVILNIEELKDYFYKPFVLERSIGYLNIETTIFGLNGDVFVDGRRVGNLPVKKLEVCSGSHSVKVAFPTGFFIKTVEVNSDEIVKVNAVPKPSLLYVGTKPLKNGVVNFTNFENNLITALKEIKIFNASSNREYLSSVDNLLNGDRKTIEKIKEDYGESLVLFGIEKRVRLRRIIDFYIFNTDFFKPEKITVNPTDAESMKKLINFINSIPQIVEYTADITVINDPEENKPVIIDSHNELLKRGDVVLAINDKEVFTEKDVYSLLKAPSVKIKVERGKEILEFDVKVVKRPLQIRQNLNSLCYNSAYLYFKSNINNPDFDEVEVNALKLNLGICFLRFGMFENAYDVFSSIKLPDTPGISAGTILFLKGVCYQEIGLWSDLQMLYNQYNYNENATIINSHGFKVKDLIDFTKAYLQAH
ncbi:hypothetical protein TTHT_0262 [Thermotomaculum hydrothermale]|uniref:PEGA domain-containing protein n=1 Tax=Thermotomaculum hydrothermale TaxID=981385 RepID=A0A7R6PPB3_9BACT|nr:PEGA domain-containing protein [Thermotomaculum hydrothermale]BBB31886.1 hypothetical protein TTHT_0262 [Thermotomaculum hydrothermale]